MKRSTKQLLSLLLAIVMVCGLMAPAMAARPTGGDVAETPVSAETPAVNAVSASRASRETAELMAATTTTLNAKSDFGNITADAAVGDLIVSGTNDEVPITAAEMTALHNGYFSVTGDVVKRVASQNNPDTDVGGKVIKSSTAVTHIEVKSAASSSVNFTVAADTTAAVTMTVSSTGGSNWSAVELQKQNGTDWEGVTATITSATELKFIGENTTTPVFKGTSERTVTFSGLEAGTYRVVSPVDPAGAESFTKNDGTVEASRPSATADYPFTRNTRIFSLAVTETAVGGEGGGEEGGGDDPIVTPGTPGTHTMTVAAVDGLGDKAAITQTHLTDWSTPKDSYFSIVGSGMVYRTTPAIEVGKAGAGSVGFTIAAQTKAKVTATVASTGGSNDSNMVLYNTTAGKAMTPATTGNTLATDSKIEGDIVVAHGTAATTVVWENALPGTYYVGTDKAFTARGGRILEVKVEESAWTGSITSANATADQIKGENPAITDVAVANGKITAKVTGPRVGTVESAEGENIVYTKYADKVVLKLYDESNATVVMDGTKEITATSTKEGTEHTFTITPKATGKYTLKAFANDSIDVASYTTAIDFSLPLGKPAVTATAKEGNVIDVSWNAVAEADSYNLYMSTDANNKGTAIDMGTNLTYKAENLTSGTAYYFWVEVVRGTEKVMSDSAVDVATSAAPVEWTYTECGENASSGKSATVGMDANGKKTVRIQAAGNKFQTSSPAGEGIDFYYTKVPTTQNFTLKAKVHVNSWKEDNSQVAFGLLATDYVLNNGNGSGKYTPNMVFVGAADYGGGITGTKQARIGLGAWLKHGATTKDSVTGLSFKGYNLDTWCTNYYETVDWTKWSRYTVVGNNTTASPSAFQGGGTKDADGNWSGITDFIFQLQRNNMGYYVTYMDEQGNNLGPNAKQIKIYEPDALSVQEPDYIYVGLMAARRADATFSNIEFEAWDKATDDWSEEKEYDLVDPSINLVSATQTNHGDYAATFTSNVRGDLKWTINGKNMPDVVIDTIKTDYPNTNSASVIRGDSTGTLKEGINTLKLTFTPWPEEKQTLAEGQKLKSTEPVEVTKTVVWDVTYKDRNNLYVSATATAFGDGTESNPMTLNNAVKYVQPGQKIILKEGTYKINNALTLPLGTDGVEDAPIYLMADPEAATRPVLDFQKRASGMSLLGNYWYLYGFDIANGTGVGLQIGGSYNTIDSVNFYRNAGSGMQISRVGGHNAALEYWPHNNLVWRCASFLNADAGETAADGFAHKETAGNNNVFRDCVSAYNSDDGWDFYAKKGNGSIGDCTIDHCVSYRNGYIEKSDGTLAKGKGGGNGFKMGGDNVPSAPSGHVGKNSFAYQNGHYGFTSNSTPTIHLTNCVLYSNGEGISLYGDGDKNFSIDGLINIGGGSVSMASGSPTNVKSASAADVFVTTTFVDPVDNANNTIKRDADGYVDFGGFFTMKEGYADSAVFPKVEAINYPAFSDNQVPDFTTITPDVVESSDKGGSSRPGDRGEGVTDPGTTTDPTKPDEPVKADDVKVEKTETAVKADGTKVTTTQLSNGSTAVTEVTLDGAVSVDVTNKDGEKIVAIDVPAEIPVSETKFEDVAEDHWAAAAIDRMAALGMVRGVGEGNYDTDGEVTRATLATMLFRFSNGAEGKTTTFADVPSGEWYADAIGWANAAGVVTGYSETTFGPNDQLTREQMAVMLLRFAKLIGMDSSVDADAVASFADADSVNSWAADGMAWCVKNGIINGTGDNTLAPGGSATRAQTAVMLDRFIGLLK